MLVNHDNALGFPSIGGKMWAENLASVFEQVAQETGLATAAVMCHHFVKADIASLEAPGRRLIFSRLQD